jgi:VIT1/CCC1 family predicted Fe2+/Mn2+ transporter
VGVAAAQSNRGSILVAGMSGLVAGAMSMAAGEYVSVSSQSDTERADLEREREELATDVPHEHAELAAIYVGRGLDAELASQVATQLMAKDALSAHARDELDVSETLSARPVQAALASAATFAFGAAMPLLLVLFVPTSALVWTGIGQFVVVSRLLGFACGPVREVRPFGSPSRASPFGELWRWPSPPGSALCLGRLCETAFWQR